MGFTAPNCTCCGEPIVGYHAVYENMAPEWMSYCLAISPSGLSFSGVYDGYGRVRVYQEVKALVLSHIGLPESGARDIMDDEGWFDVRHQACSHYDKFGHRSEHARCQGWFFEEDMFGKAPYVPDLEEYEELVYDCMQSSPYLSDYEDTGGIESVSKLASVYLSEGNPVEWFVNDLEELIVRSINPDDKCFYRDVFDDRVKALLNRLEKESAAGAS